jgi:hypothetical protein
MIACPGIEIENFAAKKDQAAVLQNYVEQVLKTLGWHVHTNSAQGILKIGHASGGKTVYSKFQIFSMNAYVLPLALSPYTPACRRLTPRMRRAWFARNLIRPW